MKPMPDSWHTPDRSPCGEFDAQINRALDGEFSVTELSRNPHLSVCADCRSSLAAVPVLLEALQSQAEVVLPSGFAERVVPRVLAERKQTAERKWGLKVLIGSLAASVAFAFVVAAPWRSTPTIRTDSVAVRNPTEKLPSVSKSFADAGTAFVSLTKRAANETLAPARKLFAVRETAPTQANTSLPRPGDPVPAATSTIQPITDTTKRAINLFLRDVGSLTSIPNKMKS
jgi:anti-sigma factor RsiW